MTGNALDIGGSRARLYRFEQGQVQSCQEIWLPPRQEGEDPLSWGGRRVVAIAELVASCQPATLGKTLPTACAGRKDAERNSVILSFYGSPLPDLVLQVADRTGIQLGPLLDDDVCAGWGHLASPRGGLRTGSPDTVLLTAGTGVAECLWVGGSFLPKESYPRLADLDLEAALRAEAWRHAELPLEALARVLQERAKWGDFRRLVLSGRFAADLGARSWPEQLGQAEVLVQPLPEAPALGALALTRRASTGQAF
jgi:hypothetical protein